MMKHILLLSSLLLSTQCFSSVKLIPDGDIGRLIIENSSSQRCTYHITVEDYSRLTSTSDLKWHKKSVGKYELTANSNYIEEFYSSEALDWRYSLNWKRCD
ncbi:hypothetical protein [Vibrio alginolyticus]|uniref:hypothetical protein n=1 Tax=Vibrio alginolyticus TaxID=663 RepID=UPI000721DA95|nr:hypothetical protein [Vibrio alginolyticus]ALR91991.1 hypothetical protein AT730_06120 [Vibrio alginolyticus]MBY7682578.1 hypothetical protein [Vibrio alginolyticus]